MQNKKRPIVITLDAQLKAHYNDAEKTKAALQKYLGMYENAPQTENVKFRINNFKQLIHTLENQSS